MAKLKGVDLDAPGNINGVPVLEVEMESFEEKPWRKPGLCVCLSLKRKKSEKFLKLMYFIPVVVWVLTGADLSDYFNYGFNEDTWKAYCEKQKRLRMGLEVSTVGSVTSKITVRSSS